LVVFRLILGSQCWSLLQIASALVRRDKDSRSVFSVRSGLMPRLPSVRRGGKVRYFV